MIFLSAWADGSHVSEEEDSFNVWAGRFMFVCAGGFSLCLRRRILFVSEQKDSYSPLPLPSTLKCLLPSLTSAAPPRYSLSLNLQPSFVLIIQHFRNSKFESLFAELTGRGGWGEENF
jgi:hypothetical protein